MGTCSCCPRSGFEASYTENTFIPFVSHHLFAFPRILEDKSSDSWGIALRLTLSNPRLDFYFPYDRLLIKRGRYEELMNHRLFELRPSVLMLLLLNCWILFLPPCPFLPFFDLVDKRIELLVVGPDYRELYLHWLGLLVPMISLINLKILLVFF